MQDNCTAEKLAEALHGLLADAETFATQRGALDRIPELMQLSSGTPSEAAAQIVIAHAIGRCEGR
jgi:hypothetical protein